MATLPRSSIIQPSDTVALCAKFAGPDGQPTDLDAFPNVTIVQPSGNSIGPITSGIKHIATGEYEYDYSVGLFPPLGTWRDVWRGIMAGFEVIGEFTFTVYTTQTPGLNTDGYEHLGDDPGFNYSQVAIHNINVLMKSVRARLKSRGKKLDKDEYGNEIYKDCDIFSVDELVTFIARSLSAFNEIPHFTMFTFEDTPILEQFHDVLVQGAVIFAMGAQALIERGREFQIQDNGVGFTPPTISELLNSQMGTELTNWTERVKQIKGNMRPSPIALGTLSFTSGASPQFRRLRHLRQRKIY
jgi:hypothetical protein